MSGKDSSILITLATIVFSVLKLINGLKDFLRNQLLVFFKVMCMSSEELDIYDENDGWSDDEVDEELEGMDTLSNGGLLRQKI